MLAYCTKWPAVVPQKECCWGQTHHKHLVTSDSRAKAHSQIQLATLPTFWHREHSCSLFLRWCPLWRTSLKEGSPTADNLSALLFLTPQCEDFDFNDKYAVYATAANFLIKYGLIHITAPPWILLLSHAIFNACKNPDIDMDAWKNVCPCIWPWNRKSHLATCFATWKSYNDDSQPRGRY